MLWQIFDARLIERKLRRASTSERPLGVLRDLQQTSSLCAAFHHTYKVCTRCGTKSTNAR
jgi:hypothetical protein